MGPLHQELEALQAALRDTIPNAFVTVTDDLAQEIPIMDIAIAVCEASADAFVAVSTRSRPK